MSNEYKAECYDRWIRIVNILNGFKIPAEIYRATGDLDLKMIIPPSSDIQVRIRCHTKGGRLEYDFQVTHLGITGCVGGARDYCINSAYWNARNSLLGSLLEFEAADLKSQICDNTITAGKLKPGEWISVGRDTVPVICKTYEEVVELERTESGRYSRQFRPED